MTVARTAILVGLTQMIISQAVASSEVVDDWRNLHMRCQTAVETAEMLDIAGLEERDPTLIADIVDDAPFGVRTEYDVLRTSARTVPTGIWGTPDGRFELQLLEFTTRPGTRAICEVRDARDSAPLNSSEASSILSAFDEMSAAAIETGAYERANFESAVGVTRTGMTLVGRNPRGCPVAVSATSDPAREYFRTAAAERAGVPECGGPSLAAGGLTTSPAALNPRTQP